MRTDHRPAGALDPARPAGQAAPPAAEAGPAVAPDRRPCGRARQALAWARAHWLGIAVLAGMLAAVGAVHANGMTEAPQRLDDEGTYIAQAWAVQNWRTLGHYTYWYDHPPLGWILIAGYTWATGAFGRAVNAVAAGREAMLVAQLAAAALTYLLARRVGLRRPAAAGAVALFAFAPVALHFHRMVLLDNVAMPFVLAAFALAASPPRRLAAHAASGLCFGVAVLCKETMLLLLPALAWQLWQAGDRRTRRYGLALAGSLFVLVGTIYVLYATLRGELIPGGTHVSLLDGIGYQLAGRPASGSPFDPGSGTRTTIGSWLGLDPWLLAAAVALVPVGFATRSLRPVTAAFAILALALLRPGYVPVPFVIGMLPFAALIVAGAADRLWPRRAAGASPVPVAPIVAAGAVLALAAVVVAPSWVAGDRRLTTEDEDAPLRRAQAWVTENVPRTRSVMVDDSLWVDLVRAGYPAERVVWFYKLDTDRDVQARYPNGWRDVNFVVSTPTMRAFPEDLPQARDALRNSEVVDAFGEGDRRVEIRRVRPPPSG
jgi:hypothetical protein